MKGPFNEEQFSAFHTILKAAQAIINGTCHPGKHINVTVELSRKIGQHIERLEIDIEQKLYRINEHRTRAERKSRPQKTVSGKSRQKESVQSFVGR
jgi:hypothetical protein